LISIRDRCLEKAGKDVHWILIRIVFPIQDGDRVQAACSVTPNVDRQLGNWMGNATGCCAHAVVAATPDSGDRIPLGGTMTFLSETPERMLSMEALVPIGFGSRRSSDKEWRA
jgi:hypothetical protein